MIKGSSNNAELFSIETSGGISSLLYYSKIIDCHNTAKINGEQCIGGLSGIIAYSIIEDSFNSGAINGEKEFGGLIGTIASPSYFYEDFNNDKHFNKNKENSHSNLISIDSQIKNSYYNYNILINGKNQNSIGVLEDSLYNKWINNNKALKFTDYFKTDKDSNLVIANLKDFNNLKFFGMIPNKKYILINDLDFKDVTNVYIPYFTGFFNGNNKVIKNLNLNLPEEDDLGLFCNSDNAVFSNLTLQDITISGHNRIGGLIGSATSTSIVNCSINGTITGNNYVGGIVGCSPELLYHDDSNFIYSKDKKNSIDKCYSSGIINGNDYVGGISGSSLRIKNSKNEAIVTGNDYIGGLSGTSGDYISNSKNTGKVTGQLKVGGLAGYAMNIYNSYNTGEINGSEMVGGLSGISIDRTLNCYNIGKVIGKKNVSGINGKEKQKPTASYWNSDTTGLIKPLKIYTKDYSYDESNALTTQKLKDISTFTNSQWDFTKIWKLDKDINNGYPSLQWEK